MRRNRIVRTLLAAIAAMALAAPPAQTLVCGMSGHGAATVVPGHRHAGVRDASVTNPAGCAECGAMAGCCVAPAGAVEAVALQIPTLPEQAQIADVAAEHLASNLLPPRTPPPRA